MSLLAMGSISRDRDDLNMMTSSAMVKLTSIFIIEEILDCLMNRSHSHGWLAACLYLL